ncbi:MAG: hypothetical protein A2663_02090 [Candidatus Buchananbacteria bacterium RIFCSPHIGHO2_01_FULL_46_12]|uniref:Beta-hydroxyacyl-ACP dehydratase n=1 Tax=Candidatus Buchananbacteria bacterium RIFCSPHIGHO2_01_FULL_46_12 TaxID=1797536 RepID=A0A1G1Y565_9BACT|nr:MAG: hypothetical protein A2663_02090 [Candidatus Buchananbacteria bacterium RIFCSPHIGHO2_01_FULL_46_12]
MPRRTTLDSINESLAEIVPHGSLRFVEEIRNFDLKKRTLKATLKVTKKHCDGHYPGQPIFPGLLSAEALVQAGSVLLYLLKPARYRRKSPVLVTMNGLQFKEAMRPGDLLWLEVKLTRLRWSSAQFMGRIYIYRERKIGREAVSDADRLTAAIIESWSISFLTKTDPKREN